MKLAPLVSLAVVLATTALLSRPSFAQCSAPLFGGGPVLATGGAPRAVLAGDFNEDGNLDLAVLASADPSMGVWVYPGNGDGTFAVPRITTLGGSPRAMAAGNLDGDAHLDLAVAAPGDATVKILRGDGTGAFSLAQTIPVEAGATGIVIADLNADGAADIATSHAVDMGSYFNGFCTVMLGIPSAGAGSGQFATPNAMPFNNGGKDIAAGDFNEDGITDLILSQMTAELRIFLGQGSGGVGNGTFKGTLFYWPDWGFNGGALQAVKVDGDAHLDLVDGSDDGLALFRGNGDATFNRPPTAFPVGEYPGIHVAAVVVGDWNHDGKLDFGGVDPGASQFYFGLGNGNGTLGPMYSVFVAGRPIDVTAADFDRNGSLDLAIVSNLYKVVSVIPGLCTAKSTAVEEGDPSVIAMVRVLRVGRSSLELEYAAAGPARFDLFDVAGRRAVPSLLVAGSPGVRRITWDHDRFGAGVYLVRLEDAGVTRTRRFVVTE